jgi:hypothetical protein
MFVISVIGMNLYPFQSIVVKHLNPQTAFATSNNTIIKINNTNGQYVYANNTQDWTDRETNLKIHFMYLPEYPLAGNITRLMFEVQDLQNGRNLKDLFASITITNNLTTAKIDGINDTNGEFSRFMNVSTPNGVFSLNYRFLEEGVHQVIVNLHSKNFALALASFNVSVQPVV